MKKVLATVQIEIEVSDDLGDYDTNSEIASVVCDIKDGNDDVHEVHYNYGDYQVEA